MQNETDKTCSTLKTDFFKQKFLKDWNKVISNLMNKNIQIFIYVLIDRLIDWLIE